MNDPQIGYVFHPLFKNFTPKLPPPPGKKSQLRDWLYAGIEKLVFAVAVCAWYHFNISDTTYPIATDHGVGDLI